MRAGDHLAAKDDHRPDRELVDRQTLASLGQRLGHEYLVAVSLASQAPSLSSPCTAHRSGAVVVELLRGTGRTIDRHLLDDLLTGEQWLMEKVGAPASRFAGALLA